MPASALFVSLPPCTLQNCVSSQSYTPTYRELGHCFVLQRHVAEELQSALQVRRHDGRHDRVLRQQQVVLEGADPDVFEDQVDLRVLQHRPHVVVRNQVEHLLLVVSALVQQRLDDFVVSRAVDDCKHQLHVHAADGVSVGFEHSKPGLDFCEQTDDEHGDLERVLRDPQQPTRRRVEHFVVVRRQAVRHQLFVELHIVRYHVT